MTELVTLASTVGRPRATRVGKRISEPPPAIELIPPARKATPAAMARSRADTTAEITVGRVAVPWRAVGLAVVLGGSGVLHLGRPGLYEWVLPPRAGFPPGGG